MYTLFDLVVVIVVGLLGFSGLRKGLIVEALKLIGFIFASYLAVRYYVLGVLLIKNIFSVSEGIQTIIGFIIVFLIVYFSIQLISALLKRIVRTLNLAWLDRLAGLGFGAIKAILVMSIVAWCLSIFTETKIIQKLEASSPSYIYLDKCERFLIRTFSIEEQTDSLKKNIRSIFMLEKEISVSFPSIPDTLGKKTEFIDRSDSKAGETVW
jgi:membrane protein required for colicin V production